MSEPEPELRAEPYAGEHAGRYQHPAADPAAADPRVAVRNWRTSRGGPPVPADEEPDISSAPRSTSN